MQFFFFKYILGIAYIDFDYFWINGNETNNKLFLLLG